MDSLEPHQRAVRLRCPECHDGHALACKITRSGEGVWVTLIHQYCECDPYADWDDVWEQARDLVQEGELDD